MEKLGKKWGRPHTNVSILKQMKHNFGFQLHIEVYQKHGYKDREEYIETLKEEYGAELVDLVMSCLPPSEDFHGLPAMLEEEYENENYWRD